MSRAPASCVERAQRQVLPLQLSLYHAARDYPGGAAAIAAIYGRSPSSLSHKLSPTNPRNVITPDEIEEVTTATRDPRIVDSVIEAYGDAAWTDLRDIAQEIDRDCDTTASVLKAIGETLQRQSKLTATIAEHLANDGEIDAGELAQQKLLLRRLQGALILLERRLEQESEGTRHGR